MSLALPRFLVIFALLGAGVLLPTTFAAERTATPHPILSAQGLTLPNRYIVILTEGGDPRSVAAMTGVQPTHLYTAALQGFAAVLNAGQLTALRHNPNVEYIEHDAPVTLDATQTMDANGDPWGLDRIDQRALPLSRTYTYTATGAGVTAYIIDTGLQANHPDFGGRAANVYDASGGNGDDCNGHGTHVAGTVGGGTYGVAKQVQLRGVRVLTTCDTGSGAISGVIAGVDWVRANAQKPAVANMSLGGSSHAALNTAVASLANSGVFVAVSAGNDNVDACTQSPASTPEAYTVAASVKTDAKAPYSNYGACVDLYAPGTAIKSASLNSGTAVKSGTSMASPHAAGVAALYKSVNGDAASATISSWLNTNATPNVIGGNPSGTPNRLLYVNLSPVPTPTPTPPPTNSYPSVSAGNRHTCAVRTDQTVVCWGDTSYGKATPPSGSFTQVSAGRDHTTCGVRTTGTVACWGDNTAGQATPPSGSFTQVSVGLNHTCGVRTTGTVACWGDNTAGQATPPSGSFTQVSAGWNHTCAMRTDQTVVCWSGGMVSGGFLVASVGDQHACGVRTDQTVLCWGANTDGQATPPSGSFTQVSAGGNHTCGLRTDQTVACWGRNTDGQATPPSGSFLMIDAGAHYNCGVRTDRTVACWGSSRYGRTSPPSGSF